MQLTVEQAAPGVQLIHLIGRLDIVGTQLVDLKFTAYTASRKAPVLVDLSQVHYIASVGIRLLLTNASALDASGAKMVLLQPQPVVEQILRTAGLDQVMPIAGSIEEGLRIISA
jgi:anti-sigma B factor antagonist